MIEKNRNVKVETIIKKDGDAFVITRVRPDKTLENKLVLGKENDVETMLGKNIKVCWTNCIFLNKKYYNLASVLLSQSFYSSFFLKWVSLLKIKTVKT